jgi:hypothetical protein
VTLPVSDEIRRHYDRKQRKAMRAMAIACGLDPDSYPGPDELWRAISEHIAGGIPRANANLPGDPFALFLTAMCPNHRGKAWEGTYVIKSETGGPIDEAEGERMIAYLKSKQPDCQECGEPITTWSSDMTRISVFADKQRQLGKVQGPVAVGGNRAQGKPVAGLKWQRSSE